MKKRNKISSIKNNGKTMFFILSLSTLALLSTVITYSVFDSQSATTTSQENSSTMSKDDKSLQTQFLEKQLYPKEKTPGGVNYLSTNDYYDINLNTLMDISPETIDNDKGYIGRKFAGNQNYGYEAIGNQSYGSILGGGGSIKVMVVMH